VGLNNAGGGIRVAVDVGGTFTDVIALRPSGKKIFRIKVLSTPADPSVGVLEGIRRVVQVSRASTVDVVVHATTLGTNVFLGQEGLELPKAALITTEGFRDVLEIGRQRRAELYNPFFTKPKPLIPRRLRFTVAERISHDGKVLKPLSSDELMKVIAALREEDVKSVAIAFLHSYVNPEHERTAEKLVNKELPNAYIVPSYKVDPEYREFERVSTTVVNAVLMPLLSKYFSRLNSQLKDLGLGKPELLIMKSDGGFSTSTEASKVPAATVESGPAAGVIAASRVARELGIRRVLSFDMGGTTAKVSTILDGRPEVTKEFEVGGKVHKGRLIRGSGYVIRYPHLDLVEVSAGGGTIAWVDEAGHLRVGPYSAGSEPGPASYGKGGKDPTVTDANLLLGRLGDSLAGGEITLSKDLALQAFRRKVCDPSGLNLREATYGTLTLANVEMSRAIRIATVEKGYDPREFTLIAFGGAGPMHACDLAAELDLRRVVIPPAPGVFSALGLLLADYRHEFKASVLKPLSNIVPEELEETFSSMESEARRVLTSEGVPVERIFMLRYADMRYLKQSHELVVEAPKPFGEKGINYLREAFTRKHKEIYGYFMSDEIIVVNARVSALGEVIKPPLRKEVLKEPIKASPNLVKAFRRTYFRDSGWIRTAVYTRNSLRPGYQVEGPAIIEEYDSTTVVPPEWVLRVDEFSNLIIERI